MKVERHSKIVELIGKYEIETQEELAERLNEAGFNVTQATVSRDIRELKLTKMQSESGRQRYMVLESPRGTSAIKYIRILKDGYMSMDMAQNILVIKTVSGMAMAVAAAWTPSSSTKSWVVLQVMIPSCVPYAVWTIPSLSWRKSRKWWKTNGKGV